MEKKLTLEEAMDELAELVRQMEDEQLPLEASLALFEKGIKLSRYCRKCLDEAEKKIKTLSANKDGQPLIADLDHE